MSIRNRIMILVLLAGFIPMVLVLLQGFILVNKVEAFAVELLQPLVQQMGIESSQNTVQLISRQINSYLEANPHLIIEDQSRLRENKELAAIAATTFGSTGYTMVFNDELEVIFHRNPEMIGVVLSEESQQSEQYLNILTNSMTSSRAAGYVDWVDGSSRVIKKYLVVYQVGTTGLRVAGIMDAAEINRNLAPYQVEIQRNAEKQRWNFYLGGLAVFVLSLLGSYLTGKKSTAGLQSMAKDARRIVRSLPDPIPVPEKADDLMTLYNCVVNLAQQAREVRNSLEKQIQTYAAILGQRNMQLSTVVMLAQQAAEASNVQKLLQEAPKLISSSFGHYHTGIFLIDEAGEYAILAAASSEGGRRMLEKGHKLRLREGGVVSYAANNNNLYYVRDVVHDPVHLVNQDLIHTRSELALPIRVYGELLGILDVQSTEPEAFNKDDIKILQILADRIALAVQNGRLLQENQQTKQEMHHLYGENIRETWMKRQGSRPVGYVFNRLGVEPKEEVTPESETYSEAAITSEGDSEHLIVPLYLRGQSLGSIVLKRDKEEGGWRQEDLHFLQEVAQQVAPALENARLLEEINRRAQLEQQIGRISAKTIGTLNMEAVMRTAVQEVGLALDADRVQIRLGNSGSISEPTKNGEGA